ncbi:Uncharacterised protein [Enterococcus hirae]|nr:Uncharacterised protein [Enterococcus hirae]
MRKKFDYWGVPSANYSQTIMHHILVECDCGERAKLYQKAIVLYQCQMRKKYTLSLCDLFLIDEKEKRNADENTTQIIDCKKEVVQIWWTKKSFSEKIAEALLIPQVLDDRNPFSRGCTTIYLKT